MPELARCGDAESPAALGHHLDAGAGDRQFGGLISLRCVGPGPPDRRQHLVEDKALEASDERAGLFGNCGGRPAHSYTAVQPGLANDGDILVPTRGTHNVTTLFVVVEQTG